jgi:hypothetical protein
MAIESDENKPDEEEGATAGGMAEAVVQDVELIVDKVMDTAGDAVIIVQEKLGLRPARAKKPSKPKAKAKAPAIKAKAPAPKAKAPAARMKARTAKAMISKSISKPVKAKPAKVAKSAKFAKSAKPKPAAKSARASKGKKTGRKR